MRRTKTIMIVCGVLLGPVGCVGSQLRAEAVELAALTEHVAATGQRVQASRDALATARTDNLHQLEDSALELEGEAARSTAAWKLAGLKVQVELYQGVRSAVEAESERLHERNEQRERHAEELAAARSAANVRAKELRAVANSLSRLGEEMSTKAYIEFYADFAKEVREAIDEAKCDAEAQASTDATDCP